MAEPPVIAAAAATAPDAGLRPTPNGTLQLPSGTQPSGAAANGLAALEAQLNSAQSEVMLLAEQLSELKVAVSDAQTELIFTQYAAQEAQLRLERARKALTDAVSDAYVRSGGIPDLGLSGLNPKADDPVRNSAGAAHELALATAEAASTKAAYEKAQLTLADAQTRFGSIEISYKQRDAALQELKRRNTTQVAQILQQQELHEQSLGDQYLNTDALAGMKANPKAIKAVQFALRQLGKSYVWGAEGPDHFDCSGLTWAAYRSVDRTLPRVARDQYQGTKSASVSRYALLPGDLLFFSSDPYNADTIHHVGIYLGNGRMVHSPTTGDVVKISTVWWSHFYAATRVFPATQTSGGVPTIPTPGSTGGTSTPTPSSSASPTPTTTSPSPTPTSPSPSPTTTSPTTTSPSPAPTTTSPSPTPTSPSPAPTTTSPNTTTSSSAPNTTTSSSAPTTSSPTTMSSTLSADTSPTGSTTSSPTTTVESTEPTPTATP
jgi:cell wall-associated NlpC family hydrolase